jgi:hypothetical protein
VNLPLPPIPLALAGLLLMLPGVLMVGLSRLRTRTLKENQT